MGASRTLLRVCVLGLATAVRNGISVLLVQRTSAGQSAQAQVLRVSLATSPSVAALFKRGKGRAQEDEGYWEKKKKKNWGFFVLSFFSETQREFEKEDELRRRLENRKFFEERLAIRGGYYKALEESLKEYDQLAQKHQALLAKLKRDEDVQVFEETIEQVHSETITVL